MADPARRPAPEAVIPAAGLGTGDCGDPRALARSAWERPGIGPEFRARLENSVCNGLPSPTGVRE